VIAAVDAGVFAISKSAHQAEKQRMTQGRRPNC